MRLTQLSIFLLKVIKKGTCVAPDKRFTTSLLFEDVVFISYQQCMQHWGQSRDQVVFRPSNQRDIGHNNIQLKWYDVTDYSGKRDEKIAHKADPFRVLSFAIVMIIIKP